MTDFWEVVFTPSFIPRLLHVWAAAWTVGSALMLSVSAWYLLRRRHIDLAIANLRLALPFFILFALSNLFIFGPNQAIEVTNEQPLKLASLEGLWESTSCAPMFLLGWVDEATQTTTGISIPCLLSFLAYQDIHATVQGIDAFSPPAPTPPINLVFQVYHVMINIAPLLAGIAVLAGIWYAWDRRLLRSRFVLWLLVLSVFLGEIAITAGWWTAEIGRQPWVVYDVLKTADGVSPLLSGGEVVFSLGTFVVLYAILLALFLYLLNRKIQQGPEPLEEVETVDVGNLPDTFRDVFRRRDRAASSGEE
jgi:cytochrome d ubiquinol oxidase subunit I